MKKPRSWADSYGLAEGALAKAKGVANATPDVAPLDAVVERAHEVPRPGNALSVEPALEPILEVVEWVDMEYSIALRQHAAHKASKDYKAARGADAYAKAMSKVSSRLRAATEKIKALQVK